VRIDWVIPCRYVEVHDNLATMVGAGIDTLTVPELPVVVQVLVAVRLLALADEWTADVKHSARNVIYGPNAQVVSEVADEFALVAEGSREDWLTGVILPTVVTWEATEEGAYTLEHHVDDASAQVPLHVVLAQ
jgi:hypothetical protein